MLKFRAEIFVVIVIMAVFGSVVTSVFHVYRNSQNIKDSVFREITQKKDLKSDAIKLKYDTMIEYLRSLGAKPNDVDIFKEGSGSLIKIIEGYANYNSNYELVTEKGSKINTVNAEKIRKAFFIDNTYISPFYKEDGVLFQDVILTVNNSASYVVYKINTGILSSVLDEKDGIQIEVLSGDYYVVYSTAKNQLFTTKINDLTKRMLDGKNGVETFDGVYNSYGFIELGTFELFVNAYVSEDRVASLVNKEKVNSIFLVFFIGIISLVIASGFTKYRKKKISSLDINDIKILKSFDDNIAEAILKVDEVSKALESLRDFRMALDDAHTNIERIKGEVISKNEIILGKDKV